MSEHPYRLHRETFMSHKAAVLQLACTLLSYITQVLLLQVFQLSYLQHNFFSAQKSCIIFLGKVGNISDMSIFTWVRKTKKLKHSLYQLWVLNIYQPANQREVKGGIGTGSKFKFTLSQHKGGVPQALSQPYCLSQSSPALVKSFDKRYYLQSEDLQTWDFFSATVNPKDSLTKQRF